MLRRVGGAAAIRALASHLRRSGAIRLASQKLRSRIRQLQELLPQVLAPSSVGSWRAPELPSQFSQFRSADTRIQKNLQLLRRSYELLLGGGFAVK